MDDGSSNTSTFGKAAYADAKAIFCFSPPDSSKMFLQRNRCKFNSAVTASKRSKMSFTGIPRFSMPNTISLSVSALKNCVRGFWNTDPTVSDISAMGVADVSLPATRMLPERLPEKKCGISPFISLVIVVLPHPLAPHTRTNCPSGIANEISCTAPVPFSVYENETELNSTIIPAVPHLSVKTTAQYRHKPPAQAHRKRKTARFRYTFCAARDRYPS